MSKVYLVSSGEYSDYGINAAFSTEELAQLYIDSLGNPQGYSSMMQIEEYELDANETHLREGFKPFVVGMLRDGTTEKVGYGSWGVAPYSNIQECYVWQGYNLQKTGQFKLVVGCLAKDEAHAVKIANEKRVQLIASGEWK